MLKDPKQPVSYQSVVVLTGAGISAESGIKTFRDNDGLWENHRIEDVCTPEAFQSHPARVHQFYNARRQQLLAEARPNLAHKALADCQHQFPGSFTLITQNVDNLHEAAGSKKVMHMHGELLKVRCIHCEGVSAWEADLTQESLCPRCGASAGMRPDIVWFGEFPMHMNAIQYALQHCDLFVSIGTSGQVYPAAGFVELAKEYGAHCVELNLEASATSPYFDEQILGLASEIVPKFFTRLIG